MRKCIPSTDALIIALDAIIQKHEVYLEESYLTLKK